MDELPPWRSAYHGGALRLGCMRGSTPLPVHCMQVVWQVEDTVTAVTEPLLNVTCSQLARDVFGPRGLGLR